VGYEGEMAGRVGRGIRGRAGKVSRRKRKGIHLT
jgi:hypothetical protein